MGEPRNRDELEAIAFGAGAGPAERAEALRALGYGGARRTRTEAAPGSGPGGAAPITTGTAPGSNTGAGGQERGGAAALSDWDGAPAEPAQALDANDVESAAGSDPAPRRRTKRVVGIAAAGVGLVLVGLIGGYYIGAFTMQSNLAGTAQAGTATDDPAQTSRLAGGDPAVEPSDDAFSSRLDVDSDNSDSAYRGPQGLDTSTAAALAATLFTADQAETDEYPFATGDDTQYIASSTRLVITTGAREKIYVARAGGTDGGFCLLLSLPVDGSEGALSGAASCQTPSAFAAQGLTLQEDTLTVTWTGAEVTVSHDG